RAPPSPAPGPLITWPLPPADSPLPGESSPTRASPPRQRGRTRRCRPHLQPSSVPGDAPRVRRAAGLRGSPQGSRSCSPDNPGGSGGGAEPLGQGAATAQVVLGLLLAPALGAGGDRRPQVLAGVPEGVDQLDCVGSLAGEQAVDVAGDHPCT